MLITPELIAQMLGCSLADTQTYLPRVLAALVDAKILNRSTLIAAIATIGVETGGFKPINEYGGESYFIRNYEGRKDLGNVHPGDGALFHGRGFLQITGRVNYSSYSARLGLGRQLESNPELALDPKISAQILAQYFLDRRIPSLAAVKDWKGVRRAVNGGLNGWDEFIEFVEKCDRLLPAQIDVVTCKSGGKAWLNVMVTPGILLKRGIVAASTLPPDQLHPISMGIRFLISSWLVEEGHLKFALDLPWAKENNFSLGKFNTWHALASYVWLEPYQEVPPQGQPSIARLETRDEVLLKVPYLSQLDNALNPFGTCNVTSVAMCMAYFGHPVRNDQGQQLEDELNQYCLDHGLSRHSPTDLKKVLEAYGYKDKFQFDAKWQDAKTHLAAGNPLIAHGYFTKSGHIVTVIGYNTKGFVVNDPYGEWFSSGYDNSRSGAGLTYSYGMMERLCGSDGDLWLHFVERK